LFRVKNGEELIHYLRGTAPFNDREKHPQPALILLDLNMPKMDGREALNIIKKDENLKSIPTVILTTSKSDEDILKSYALGTNSYVRKPVTFSSLVDIMKSIGAYWLEVVELPVEED
jgi:two-component system response regulator